MMMKRTVLCLLLLGMFFQNVSSNSGNLLIVVANSIDSNLNSDFTDFLRSGWDVSIVHPSEFDAYRTSPYIIILGGHKAPEGTGELVKTILTEDEKTSDLITVKLQVWQPHQVVVVIAGSEREETRRACEENMKVVKSLFDGVATVSGMGDITDSVIFLWLSPLSPVDRIAPFAPSFLFRVDEIPHLIFYPLKEDVWFFWIDDAPSGKYAHPTRFVFFGIETGLHTVYEEEWWPVLNGESLWVESDQYWDNALLYNPEFTRPRNSVIYTVLRGDLPVEEVLARGLIINGSSPGQPLYDDMAEDERGMKEAFARTGMRVESVHTVEEIQYILPKWAREMGSHNVLIVYITAHGGRGYFCFKGKVFTIEEFVRLLTEFEHVHIHIIIDVSYAGALIQPLKMVAETVITSTGEKAPAYGDWDPDSDFNPGDRGSEFTSGLCVSIKELARDKTRTDQWKYQASQIDGSWYIYLLMEAFKTAQELDACASAGLTTPLIWALEPEPPSPVSGGGGCPCGGS
jgi:hypothetical protein